VYSSVKSNEKEWKVHTYLEVKTVQANNRNIITRVDGANL
jgi:hypothetical protein